MALHADLQYCSAPLEAELTAKRCVYVLDTNVVSALESIAVSGYNRASPDHNRAIGFLRLFDSRRASSGIDITLDAIEGSSFHNGSSDYFNSVRRGTAVAALAKLSGSELDNFVSTGAPLRLLTTLTTSEEVQTRTAWFNQLQEWIFQPSYAVALAIRISSKSNGTPSIMSQLRSIVQSAGALPDVPVMAGLLAQQKSSELSQILNAQLFKICGGDPRKACLSAAWDLAYWNYLGFEESRFRNHDLPIEEQPEIPEYSPILVTADVALSKLARALRMVYVNSLSHQYRPRFDVLPHYLSPAQKLSLDEQRSELEGASSLTTSRLNYIPIIRAMEKQLSIEPVAFDIFSSERHVRVNTAFALTLLNVIHEPLPICVDRVRQLDEQGHETIYQLIKLAGLLTHEDAQVHNRTVTDSLSVLTQTFEKSSHAGSLIISLIHSALNGRPGWPSIYAALKTISINNLGFAVIVGFLKYIRTVLESIAAGKSTSLADEIASTKGTISRHTQQGSDWLPA